MGKFNNRVKIAALALLGTALSVHTAVATETATPIEQMQEAPTLSLRLQGYTMVIEDAKEIVGHMVENKHISFTGGLKAHMLIEKQKDTVVEECINEIVGTNTGCDSLMTESTLNIYEALKAGIR